MAATDPAVAQLQADRREFISRLIDVEDDMRVVKQELRTMGASTLAMASTTRLLAVSSLALTVLLTLIVLFVVLPALVRL